MRMTFCNKESSQAKRDESQERETALAYELLNRMRELGRPQSYPVR